MVREATLPVVWAVASAALAAASADATAQQKRVPDLQGHIPTGSHIKQDPTQLKGNELHAFFDSMATCVMRRSPERADYFLRMSDNFAIADEIDVTELLPLSACVGAAARANSIETQARFSPQALRNWLSEKAYLSSQESFSPLDADAVPVARTYFSDEKLGGARALGTFADCVVAADAEKADALLRTERGSTAERTAAGALAPAMGSCLPEGATFRLDLGMVRGVAAQGLWQRYEAPKPVRYKADR